MDGVVGIQRGNGSLGDIGGLTLIIWMRLCFLVSTFQGGGFNPGSNVVGFLQILAVGQTIAIGICQSGVWQYLRARNEARISQMEKI